MGIGRESVDSGIAFVKPSVLALEFEQEGLKLPGATGVQQPCLSWRQVASPSIRDVPESRNRRAAVLRSKCSPFLGHR